MYIILVASLAPVILLMLYIYKKDKYQKEPLPMLLKAFLAGVLAAALDILLLTSLRFAEITTFSSDLTAALYQAFCLAAMPEEFCKLLLLYLFIWNSKFFDEYYDGIEYAAFVGLGFAGIENIMYVFQGGMGVAVSRALFAVPAHFFFAIIMGYFFSFAKFRPWKKRGYLLLAYLCPVILHGIYDFVLMYGNLIHTTDMATASVLNIVFFVFFVIVWRVAIRRVQKVSGQ